MRLPLDPAGVPRGRYTDAYLDHLREVGDDDADRLMRWIEGNHEAGTVNRLLHHFIQNRQPLPSQLPHEVQRFMAEHGLPEMVEFDRVGRASELFEQRGLLMGVILATDALLECYAARKGVQVLAFTYRMAYEPLHRVMETSQFMVAVQQKGGLSDQGQGVPAAQKVRLMHAAIRYLIEKHGGWDSSLGVPICQEDLLGTLTTFSFLVVRDLEHLGITVEPELAEDFLYLWQVIGKMLGIMPEAIPTSMAEAEQLAYAIRDRQHGRSEAGIAMTRALLDMHRQLTPFPALLGGWAPALMRRLCGHGLADLLDVPRSLWDPIICHERMTWLALAALNRWGTRWMDHQVFVLNGYRRAPFDIPAQLRKRWRLKAQPA